jgi:transcriptional regulator of heat shock response
MAERPELTTRKATVLHTIVEAYVATGEPVGSEAIGERAKLGVSSATIRNEMAALEEQGYLTHPHTSAGRAHRRRLRHYVDTARARLPEGCPASPDRLAFAEVILDPRRC